VAGGIGLLLAYHSLTVGLVGVVVAVTTCVAAVAQLVFGWLIDGRPPAAVLAGGLLCMAAVVLSSVPSSAHPAHTSAGAGAAAGAGFLFALFVVLISRGSDASLWTLSVARLAVVVVALAAAAAMMSRHRPAPSAVAFASTAGALDVASNLFLLGALAQLPLSTLAAFQAASPLVAAGFAWAFLRERLARRQLAAMALALVGLVLALAG
jgi:drug/metabolite transporter (DMT)-like permease